MTKEAGAIYVWPGVNAEIPYWEFTCFCYVRLGCNGTDISFINNSAGYGGDDIYGASNYTCWKENQCKLNVTIVNPGGISSVSSDPLGVCICDSPPHCGEFIITGKVHPGETFTVLALLVGWEYGTTTGVVYADFLHTEKSTNMTLHSDTHVINNK